MNSIVRKYFILNIHKIDKEVFVAKLFEILNFSLTNCLKKLRTTHLSNYGIKFRFLRHTMGQKLDSNIIFKTSKLFEME